MLKIPAMINIMVSQEMARLLARLASLGALQEKHWTFTEKGSCYGNSHTSGVRLLKKSLAD